MYRTPLPEFACPAWEGYFRAQTHHEGPLLVGSLEATVAKLGGGVDEFQLHGLQSFSACVDQKGLGRQEEMVTAEIQRRGRARELGRGEGGGLLQATGPNAVVKMLGLDWGDPDTGSSSALEAQCGSLGQTHFLSSGWQ